MMNEQSSAEGSQSRTDAYVVGLTGNIGTGKSTILKYMAAKGVYILDADKIAHETMLPGGPAYQPIIDAFGDMGESKSEIVGHDRLINRKALGAIVFAEPKLLAKLEAIVHPAVFALTQQYIAKADAAFIILEAIKLLDGGTVINLCNEIWVVTASPPVQSERLQETRNMDLESIQQRLDAQSPQSEKIKQADRVISNDGTIDDLHQILDEIWADLSASR